MALINCQECNQEISDKANICPHCGFPIAMINKEDVQLKPSEYKNVFTPKIFDTVGNLWIDKKNRLARNGLFGKTFSFDDIMSVEIYENGSSVSKTSTSSMVGRSIVGGLISPVGAVIGGLSAKRKSVDIVNRIEVVISVKNIRPPTIVIPVKVPKKTKKDSKEYNRAIGKARDIEASVLALFN